ncbi:MAG: hypothetical protein HWE35_03500 [Rhodobacteraceae bacterium]|nr:hypothetical protein [Paracoccaceae bacterium]
MRLVTKAILFVASVAVPNATLGAADPAEAKRNEGFIPFAGSPLRDEPEFVLARCHSLVNAMQIRRQIHRSNPVTGRNWDLKTDFDWVFEEPFKSAFWAAWARHSADNVRDYTKQYMDTFGPIRFPSTVRHHPLFVSDKATCLENFGNDHEKAER